MRRHYLVDPVACPPASGWEKGPVEKQAGLVRERFFTPRLRVASYDELNGVLLDKTIAYARAHRHPEFRDQTNWEDFEAERSSLVPYAGRFDAPVATHQAKCTPDGNEALPRDFDCARIVMSEVGDGLEIALQLAGRQLQRGVSYRTSDTVPDHTTIGSFHTATRLHQASGLWHKTINIDRSN